MTKIIPLIKILSSIFEIENQIRLVKEIPVHICTGTRARVNIIF